MRTVAIVGAGGSLAHALSIRAAQQRYHPPLNATFFDKVQQLRGQSPTVATAIRSLEQLVAQTDRFQLPRGSQPSTLEQFFADVYYEVAREREEGAYEIYLALLRLYTSVLATTTNWMAVRNGKLGSMGRFLRRELANASSALTVITFNQDLVIENSALKLPRGRGRCCLRSLYGDVDLVPLEAMNEVPSFPQHVRGCTIHEPPLTLLKLHGSLNWGVGSRDRNPPLGVLFSSSKDRSIYVMDRRELVDPVNQMYRSSNTTGRKNWYLQPLVIPPIYDKSRVTGMRILSDLWGKAHEAISTAERIVFLGYSLPLADMHARQALRRAFADNRELRNVTCIDPDPSIVARVDANLDCDGVEWFANVDTYLLARLTS